MSFFSADDMSRREISEALKNRKRLDNGYTHRWTEQEDDYLRANYAQSYRSAAEIAGALGLTVSVVKHRVIMLGLGKRTGRLKNYWTDAEEKKLKDMAGKFCVDIIARRLHRTRTAVVIRLKRLSLKRRQHDGWFTKKDVCEMLGIDHHRLQGYIDSGALKASYHNGHKPGKEGLAMWHIECSDLRDFIFSHSHDFTGRNVHLPGIVEILKGGLNCQNN